VEPTAHSRPHLHFLPLFAVALALVGEGCAAFTSAGPVGPLRTGNTTQLEAAWGFAYGPATATVGGATGVKPATVKGNGEMQAAGGDNTSLPNPLPVRIGIRQAMANNLEGSADVGLVDSGIRLRVALTNGQSAPSVLAFEVRSGEVSAFPVASYQGSLAFEIYPNVTPANTHLQRRQILSVGIAGGVFQHQLALPYSFDEGDDIGLVGPSMTVLRPELRLQTAVGLYLGGGSGGFSVVVAPWVLLTAGTPTSFTCNRCSTIPGLSLFPNPTLTSFSQSWGASLIITPSLGWFHSH
jgi:hypothetical protein